MTIWILNASPEGLGMGFSLRFVRSTIIAMDKLEIKRLLDESCGTFHVGSTACHRIMFVKLYQEQSTSVFAQ